MLAIRAIPRDVRLASKGRLRTYARLISTATSTPGQQTNEPRPSRTSPRRRTDDNVGPSSPRKYALVDRPDVTEGHARPSQRPYGVAQEVTKRLRRGTPLAEVVNMVSSAPISSQNEVVWTLLVSRAFEEKQASMAFTLFNQMKKRGFVPTGRTYASVLSGFASLQDVTEKQSERIDRIWSQFQAYLVAIKSNPDLSQSTKETPAAILAPHVPYIEILGQRGDLEGIWRILEDMDIQGPYAPDKYSFTVIVQQISRARWTEDLNMTKQDFDQLKASHISKVAGRMVAAGVDSQIDSFLLCVVLQGLAKGGDAELQLAWDLAHSQIGQVDQPYALLKSDRVKMDYHLLDAILELCIKKQKFRSCIDLYNAANKAGNIKGSLTQSHAHHALDALSYLSAQNVDANPVSNTSIAAPAGDPDSHVPATSGGPSAEVKEDYCQLAVEILEEMLRISFGFSDHKGITPSIDTFDRVSVVCWRNSSMKHALRVFQIQTGLNPAQFDGSFNQGRPKSSKPDNDVTKPSARGLSYLVRIALNSSSKAEMERVLRIVQHFDFGRFGSRKGTDGHNPSYYQAKLLDSLRSVLILLLDGSLTRQRRQEYGDMLEKVKAMETKPERRGRG